VTTVLAVALTSLCVVTAVFLSLCAASTALILWVMKQMTDTSTPKES
jgi:hypothetical protein